MTLDEFVAALMDCGANGDVEVLIDAPLDGPSDRVVPVAVFPDDDGRVNVETVPY